MRIAWCTPFSRRSAIGQVSRHIIEKLRRSVEIDIWHPETSQPLETSVTRFGQLTGGPADAARLATYDLAVYALGNHLHHREIFEASRRTPGLAVLHDLVMQGFFISCYLGRPELRERYTAAMQRWYGAAGTDVARNVIDGDASFLQSDAVLEFPLFEEAIAGSYAVVTHSAFAAERVRAVFPGVVRHLALPYEEIRRRPVLRKEPLAPAGRLLAITVGDVNPNKRAHTVLQALRSDRALAARIFYVVIGSSPPEYGGELARMVKEFGLDDTVRLAGYLEDNILESYLEQADLCITLRQPTTEAASASAIEQLFHGKPVIVSATGFYRELPDDCVLKIRPDYELEDLKGALSRLASDPALRRELGRRARSYAQETFSGDLYVDGLLEIAGEILDAKPMLGFADRVGRELARMGVTSHEPLVHSVADLAGELFAKR
jgi:glycosyltransferase involved in cell wall biosynthesis